MVLHSLRFRLTWLLLVGLWRFWLSGRSCRIISQGGFRVCGFMASGADLGSRGFIADLEVWHLFT